MAKVTIICPHCGVSADKDRGQVRRSNRNGLNVYCSRKCSGLARRKNRTNAERKRLKAEYDAEYRRKNADALKAKKAAYFQRTYDPEKARIERKKRADQHAEYCRRPEYKAWKREYDRKYRANKIYGAFGPAFLTLQDLESEVLSRQTRYQISYQNGTLNKSQNRRREYVRLYQQTNCH